MSKRGAKRAEKGSLAEIMKCGHESYVMIYTCVSCEIEHSTEQFAKGMKTGRALAIKRAMTFLGVTETGADDLAMWIREKAKDISQDIKELHIP